MCEYIMRGNGLLWNKLTQFLMTALLNKETRCQSVPVSASLWQSVPQSHFARCNCLKLQNVYGRNLSRWIFFADPCHFFLNFEGWFRGLFQMYDLNGVYHEKADVRGIPKMWYFFRFGGFKPELLAVKVGWKLIFFW